MNYKRFLIVLCLVASQILAACTGQPSESQVEPVVTSAPSVDGEEAILSAADPAIVVQGFWDAMASGNIDAAMEFVADDAKCRGSCYFSGKPSFESYLEGMKDSGAVTTISIIQVDGDTVTYQYKVVRNDAVFEENQDGESMQIQDGKIIFWNNLHT
jgi:hypothetical protein